MTGPRILVAGIGNVFLGDDGFGVAVAERLARRSLPDGVVVMDAGIRGLDLTYALMSGYDVAILVDTTRRGQPPGTLYVIEPDASGDVEPTPLDAHGMDPGHVLAFLRASGAELRRLRVVGCEPETFGSDDDPCLGLSATVTAALEPAIELVESIVRDELSQCAREATGAEERADA